MPLLWAFLWRTLTTALRVESPDIIIDDPWAFVNDVLVEHLSAKARLALSVKRPI